MGCLCIPPGGESKKQPDSHCKPSSRHRIGNGTNTIGNANDDIYLYGSSNVSFGILNYSIAHLGNRCKPCTQLDFSDTMSIYEQHHMKKTVRATGLSCFHPQNFRPTSERDFPPAMKHPAVSEHSLWYALSEHSLCHADAPYAKKDTASAEAGGAGPCLEPSGRRRIAYLIGLPTMTALLETVKVLGSVASIWPSVSLRTHLNAYLRTCSHARMLAC